MLDDKNPAHPAWGGGLFLVLPAGLGCVKTLGTS